MSFLDIFKSSKRATAQTAKSRLQFIIAHERALRSGPEFLPQLQKDLIQVIAKYVEIDAESINVEVNQVGDQLELNILLPESLESLQENTNNAEDEIAEAV